MTGRTIIETAIGVCALAWSDHGLASLRLPGNDGKPSDSASRCGGGKEPHPEWLADAVDAIQRLLRGERVDLNFIRVDLHAVPEFHRRVYAVARSIPAGRGMTYGEVALAVGEPGAARAVGQALGRNPVPIVIPCHRVLAAGGRAGGFSAPGGAASKLRLLAIEGYAGCGPSLFDLAGAQAIAPSASAEP
jgi:methylated-DNA-[protein]-cysteine S-methyltransferase